MTLLRQNGLVLPKSSVSEGDLVSSDKSLLGDAESQRALDIVKGRRILSARLDVLENHFIIEFEDGVLLLIKDQMRNCCERRYISSDDGLDYYHNAILYDIQLRDAKRAEDANERYSYDVHDVQFLLVMTSLGSITFATHNVHNGYYGGFDVQARLIGEPDERE